MSITLKYEVNDGYVGSSRPQFIKITVDDLSCCDSAKAAFEMAVEMIDEDFQQKCWPVYDSNEIERKITELWERSRFGED